MSSTAFANMIPEPYKQNSNSSQDKQDEGVRELALDDPVVRVNQLELNIKFLEKQHQKMLNDLHNEVESLRQKNRDLQVQMLFSKKGDATPTSSSSEIEHEEITELEVSAVQIEALERNIAELLDTLSETETKNMYLQSVIDEQKDKITSLEKEKSMLAEGKKIYNVNVSNKQTGTSDDPVLEELNGKLEDANRLIKRLQRENEEQRKEIAILRSTLSKSKIENRRNEGSIQHRGYYRSGQPQTSRFPPLPNQPHWKNGLEHQSKKNSERGGNRSGQEPEATGGSVPTLPYLRDRNIPSTSTGYSNPAYNNYQGANHHKRGHYYHRKQDKDHKANVRGGPRKDQQIQQQPQQQIHQQAQQQIHQQPQQQIHQQPQQQIHQQPQQQIHQQPQQQIHQQPQQQIHQQPHQVSHQQPHQVSHQQPRQQPRQQSRQQPRQQARQQSRQQPRQQARQQARQQSHQPPHPQPQQQPRKQPDEEGGQQ